MERWAGRVAVVTGASAGIGAGIAKALVLNGMKVVGMARRADKVEDLVKELLAANAPGELHAVRVDLSNHEELQAAVQWTKEKLGGIDVLVNNAAVLHSTSLAEGQEDPWPKWRAMADLNLIALQVLTKEAVKDMRSRGVDDGHIVHIGSIVGTRIVDMPGGYAFAGIKHAIGVMTEGLRRELRDLGTKIRVTNISPGFVKTDWWMANGLSEIEKEKMYSENPSLEVEDIANAVIYALACPPHVQIHQLTIQPVGEFF
ncbi:farnesol dehydrogenase-like isoform X2 [Neocloeon triangulifer]|uniref:farnesol dehydrogenase-like isoform X2 n=1 Tax=Neocloeon triangulifer TaxID=2078957 RepID=UPI00286EF089|nr:farnesol dehydrogenase-like isoform X2 [Neocloeon triangulifer]